MDGRIGELAQVWLVEQPPQGSFAASFGGHHTGVELSPWMQLVETETPGEFPGFLVPGGLVMRLCMGFQLCVHGIVPVFPGQGQTDERASGAWFQGRQLPAGLPHRVKGRPTQSFSGGLKKQPPGFRLLGRHCECRSQPSTETGQMMVVDQRIVILGQGVTSPAFQERKILPSGVLPPVMKYSMRVAAV